MASFCNSDPATVVHQFSLQIANGTQPGTSTPEYTQLCSDLAVDHRRRDQESQRQRQRIRERIQTTTLSNDEYNLLRCQKQLRDAMNKFKSLIPSHLRTDEEITTWEQVGDIASAVHFQWEAKGKESAVGRAKDLFRRMCQGLNNHAGVLKMIPSENNYTSLIVGSITMIIKACSNHIEISEGFARGIVEINDAVGTVQGQVHDEPDIQVLTMRVYAQVLTYLSKFMVWFSESSRTRFLKSFNEKSLQLFQADLLQIKATTTTLAQRISNRTGADVKATKILVTEMSDDTKYLIRMQQDIADDLRARDEFFLDDIHNSLYSLYQKTQEGTTTVLKELMHEFVRTFVSSENMTQLLEQYASRALAHITIPVQLKESGSWPEHSAESPSRSDVEACIPPASALDSLEHRGADIKFESRQFEDCFDWDNVNPYPEAAELLVANQDFVARLADFTAHPGSDILYGCAWGPVKSDAPNDLRRAAAQYATLTRRRAAVLSYFVQTRHEAPPPGRTRESMELCAVLYAVLRQVVHLLPAHFVSPRPMLLAGSRVARLDGTFRTWDEANALLVDLVCCIDLPFLLLVVDGLNIIEDDAESNSNGRLERLVDSIHEIVAVSTKQKRIIKVLFTTNGVSRVLAKKLEAKDIMNCHTSPPVTPQKSRPR